MFRNWVLGIARSRLVHSAGQLAGAAVLGQLLMLGAMPALTRLYSPSDFGLFAAFSSIMGLILVISSLRYEMAIPLMRNAASARSMLMSALALNALTALCSLVLVLVWGDDLAVLLKAPRLGNYLPLIPLAILGAGSYRALNLWVLRDNGFALAARTKLLQSLTNVIVQLGAGLASFGAIGLIVGHVLGFSAGGLRLARGVGFRRLSLRSPSNRRRAGVLRRGHGNFPRFDVPAALVDMLGLQLPNLALVALFGPTVAGVYFLAERVLTAPMGIISQALAQTILAGARVTNQRREMMRQTTRVAIALVAILALPTAVIMVAGEEIFATVFNETWRLAGVYAAILMPGFALQFVYSSISTTLMATKGQKVNLIIHVTLLALKVVALAAAVRFGPDGPLSAIIALGLANVFGGLLSIGAVLVHIARTSKIGESRGLRPDIP